jgi:hypothetical protein
VGKFFRNAAMAGTVRTKSPIRLSWMRRTFNGPLARHVHRPLVSAEEAGAKMVPREIAHDSLAKEQKGTARRTCGHKLSHE